MNAIALLLSMILPQYDIVGAGEQSEPIIAPTATIAQPFTVAEAIRKSVNLSQQVQQNQQQRRVISQKTVTTTRRGFFRH